MECLVDDKVNSNLPASCPKCGLDMSSPSLSPSLTPFSLCDNCKCAITGAVVNNNPMPRTHRDFVPYPAFVGTYWCSCGESSNSSSVFVSPSSSSSTCPVTLSSQGILTTRPRSSSSPLNTENYVLYSPSSLVHNGGGISSPSPNVDPHTSSSSPTSHHPSRPCGLGLQSVEDQAQTTPCDQHPSSSQNHSPLATLALAKPEDHLVRPRLYSDSTHRPPWSIKDSSSQCCTKCGGVSRGIATTNETVSDSQPSTHQSPDTNVNDHHTQQPTPGGDNDDNPSTSPSIHPARPPTLTVTPPDVTPTFNQNDSSPTKMSPWGRRPRSATATSHDFTKSTNTESTSPFRQFTDLPVKEIDVHKTDFFGVKSDPRALQQTPTPTRSEIISHNMEHNRITTGGAVAKKISPTPKDAHHYPKGWRSPQDYDTPFRSRRHTMTSPGAELPRAVSPVSGIAHLPEELMCDLHHLEHENEDLSAEVIYSLHFRDYEIKELLGKGISSTVRRVTEKSTGVEYAVKIIDISGEKAETAQVEQTKKDTYREIKILRMCGGHPNIIELHDVFETPTFIFLVFEICKKGELFDYLTSVVSLSEKRTRIFMRQLIEAVAFFHEKNIVHRDLKPENILLDDDLNIKVSDFGFATVVEEGEELSELCGTPGYLAPEVLAHSMYENVSGYGKEVDMWACGVIMYTLLCGAPPFWNRRQMMMLRAIMSADYTFNSPEWDDITDPPKNLIKKLLVVNPKERLTAKEALQHPFFESLIAEGKQFNAKRKFRAGVFCVIFYLRLHFTYKHPPPISLDTVRNNPYSIKLMRKVIDTCAFGMYKHWVKRVDNQNRAALFEHTLRDDWKHSLMSVDGLMVVDGIKA